MGRNSSLVALSLALAAGSAVADGSVSDYFSYSGFGTAGLARTDTNNALWVQGNQTSGAMENFDYKTDSKLALQGTVTPTKWLSGTAQVLSEQRIGPDITTNIEWAFIKLQPLPGLSFRGGEMALPTFLISDSRNVGYANTWIRPPDEVYGSATFDTYKGYDVTYEHSIGAYSLTFNALAGSMIADPVTRPKTQLYIDGHGLRGYNITFDMNIVSVRVSRVTTDYDSKLNKSNLIVVRGTYTFNSAGVIYDHGDIVAQGEFVERRVGILTSNRDGLYVLGGYHLGKWLPYAIYADGKTDVGSGTVTGAGNTPGSSIPPVLSRNTVSAGLRLDWFKSVDFKAQIDHEKGFSTGTPFINAQRGFDNEGYVFSLAVDFVF